MPARNHPTGLPRRDPPDSWSDAGILLAARVERLAVDLEDFVTSRPGLSWLACVAIILASAIPILRRPVWFDEIVTHYVATLPTLTVLFASLRDSADANPPVLHLLIRATYRALGEGEWQMRLPTLVGYLVMSACLYVFVRRHCSATAAWSAALAPLLTSGSFYMAEARPYGLLMGLASVALVCWQRSTDRAGWSPWLAGSALAIAFACLSHFLGTLTLGPIAAGEALHQWQGGRLRASRWATLALAVLPIVLMRGVWSGFISIDSPDDWDMPRIASFATGYRILISGAMAPPIVCLGIMAALRLETSATERPRASGLPWPDAVAGLAFLAIPPCTILVAMLMSGPFVPRYAITGLVGFGVLAAGISVLAERRRTTLGGVWLLAILMGCGWQVVDRWRNAEPRFTMPATLMADDTTLPIVVEGPLDYLQLTYYAPPSLKARLVSLVDTDAASVHVGTRKGDLALVLLQPYGHSLRIEKPDTFLRDHSRFRLFKGFTPGWVLAKLTAEGARATIVRFQNTNAVYDVQTSRSAAR